jgi:hypothetical protein
MAINYLMLMKKIKISKLFTLFGSFLKKYPKLCIVFLGSNHPRRVDFYLRLWTKKILAVGDELDDLFHDYPYVITSENNKNILIIYVGDSLTENLSRVKFRSMIGQIRTVTYWLGPLTRMGFVNQTEYNKTINQIKLTIKKLILNGERVDRISIVWSSGTIDIRCSFYELLFSKTFNSDSEILTHYKICTEHLITKFLLPLKDELNANDIFLLSEIDTTFAGCAPDSQKEIREIRKNSQYPTLGLPAQRHNWRKLANTVSKDLASKLNINYLEINGFIDYDSGLDQLDCVHLTNPSTVYKINNSILNIINYTCGK